MLRKEDEFRGMLEDLRDIPIVGDVRGAGFFHAIELVKDRDTKEGFTSEEGEWLLRGFLSGELYRQGLICRADDRGDPVIQFSPPLICDTEQFQEMAQVLRSVLEEAWDKLSTQVVETAGAASAPMLSVRSLLAEFDLELAVEGVETPARFAGSTSPSSRIRRRSCRAGSCC